MMNHDFSKTIHSLKLASLAPRPRSRQPLAPSRCLPYLDAREQIEAALAPFLEQLIDEIPELQLHRRLYDGTWVVGLTATLLRNCRTLSTACTRLEFAIHVLDSGRRVELTCHGTVADAELQMPAVEVGLDASGWSTLDATFEAACLRFAECYFEVTARSR